MDAPSDVERLCSICSNGDRDSGEAALRKEGRNLKPHISSLTSPCIVGAQRDLLKNADTKYWSTFKGKK